MGFDQYHEPANELTERSRTFARMIASLIEEAEAISWYEQRLAVETDVEVKKILKDSEKEEFKHFSMELEWLTRQIPDWRTVLKGVLFQEGDIVEAGNRAEELIED